MHNFIRQIQRVTTIRTFWALIFFVIIPVVLIHRAVNNDRAKGLDNPYRNPVDTAHCQVPEDYAREAGRKGIPGWVARKIYCE